MEKNGIQVDLEETAQRIVARCRIDASQHAGLLASLAPDSILLLGVPHTQGSNERFAPTVRAVPLPNLIHPDRSRAEFSGAELLLTLEKRAA